MENKYQVKITSYALEQLREITQYISATLRAPDTASRWITKIRKEMSSLSHLPARFPLTDEEPWRSRGIHKMIVGNHIVYFWIDKPELTVWIVAVIYGRRNQREQLSLLEQD